MRIFIVAIASAATIGGLFLFENYKTLPKEEDYAQIVQSLTNRNQSTNLKPKPTNQSGKLTMKTPALPASGSASPIIQSSTPSPTAILSSISPTPTINSQKTSTPTPAPTSSPAISQPSPIGSGGQAGSPALSPSTTPAPTATATPAVSSQPTPAPSTGHLYYTSSYRTAKYYYCDTDADWKNLSEKYRKSYSSPETLLNDYPDRILHESCK